MLDVTPNCIVTYIHINWPYVTLFRYFRHFMNSMHVTSREKNSINLLMMEVIAYTR